MKNWVKVDFENRQIVMDRTFAKKCTLVGSAEYEQLQRVRGDYPTFSVIQRTIQKNSQKETWAGLTYEYMENYIVAHEKGEALTETLNEFNEMKLIAKCHSKSRRYPIIKAWFLSQYPEIAKFGMPENQNTDEFEDAPQQNIKAVA